MGTDEQLLAEGKTKQILGVPGQRSVVLVRSKDDITAGDGEKHHVIPGKGAWANRTTCNVFRLLQRDGLPLAFIEQVDNTTFRAASCTMYPFEVVVRGKAAGSYLKRYPDVEKWHRFAPLKSEIFLKTSGRMWKQHPLRVDDPLLVLDALSNRASLFDPSQPMRDQEPFLVLPMSEILVEHREDPAELLGEMRRIAEWAFTILEAAWAKHDAELIDFKVEFGMDYRGRLLLADVIDNDSWRVIFQGEHLDKQRYRDGSSLDDVAAHYARVADLTYTFSS